MKPLILTLLIFVLLATGMWATSVRNVPPVIYINPIIEVGIYSETNIQRRILTPTYSGPPSPWVQEGTNMTETATEQTFTTFAFRYGTNPVHTRITNIIVREQRFTRPNTRAPWSKSK